MIGSTRKALLYDTTAATDAILQYFDVVVLRHTRDFQFAVCTMQQYCCIRMIYEQTVRAGYGSKCSYPEETILRRMCLV